MLAVIGKEFPLRLARAVVSAAGDAGPVPASLATERTRESELDRMLEHLQLAEFVYEQPAVGDIEYSFKHALTHEVAYNSVLIERRKAMHERIGAALETLYADSLNDHVEQLAYHYRRSANVRKAVEYLGMAGRQAHRRWAHSESIGHLTGALQLLHGLPEGPERTRQEIGLQLAYSEAVTTAKGPSAAEVDGALRRARELCLALSDEARLFAVLLGLRWSCFFAGRWQEAIELSRQLLALAEPAQHPLRLLWALDSLGQSLYESGEPQEAREHLERAVTLIPAVPEQMGLRVEDPRSVGLSQLSWVLWTLGYPEQALGRSREALALARKLGKPYSLCSALSFAARLRQLRREPIPARELANEQIALATERGFSLWLATATCTLGWCLMEEGVLEEGINDLERGWAQWLAIGNTRGLLGAQMPEGYWRAGRLGQATAALHDLSKDAPQMAAAQIALLEGELALRSEHQGEREAEGHLRRAIGTAHRQAAKSWELRATTSLARLLAKQGKRDEARAMLAEIYGWFTEGFDTADLKDAKALLDELGG